MDDGYGSYWCWVTFVQMATVIPRCPFRERHVSSRVTTYRTQQLLSSTLFKLQTWVQVHTGPYGYFLACPLAGFRMIDIWDALLVERSQYSFVYAQNHRYKKINQRPCRKRQRSCPKYTNFMSQNPNLVSSKFAYEQIWVYTNFTNQGSTSNTSSSLPSPLS